MKKNLFDYEASLYFRGHKKIKGLIGLAIRKQFKLTKMEFDSLLSEGYSNIHNRFINDSKVRLQKSNNNKFQFVLNEKMIRDYIKDWIAQIKLNAVVSEVKTLDKNQLIKNEYEKILAEKPELKKTKERLQFIADKLGMSYESVKANYYYKTKS